MIEKISWPAFITKRPFPVTSVELYDHVADPLEMHNVVEKYPEVVAELKPKLMAWMPGPLSMASWMASAFRRAGI